MSCRKERFMGMFCLFIKITVVFWLFVLICLQKSVFTPPPSVLFSLAGWDPCLCHPCTVTVLHMVQSQELRWLEGIYEMQVDIGLEWDGFIVWLLCFVLSSASLFLVFCVCPVFACVMSRISCHTHAHTAQILGCSCMICRGRG